MADPVRVLVPKETVSDETVEVRALLYENGTHVDSDAVIAIIETSKAAVEVTAPVSGYIRYFVEPQTEVAVGAALADLAASPEDVVASTSPSLSEAHATPPKASPLARRLALQASVDMAAIKGTGARGKVTSADVQAAHMRTGARLVSAAAETSSEHFEQRISARALALIAGHDLDTSIFGARRMVRGIDVEEVLGLHQPDATPLPLVPATAASAPPSEVPYTATRPDRRKNTERAVLAGGAAPYIIPSMVAIRRPTAGLRKAIATDPSLHGSLLGLVIYESARLLHRYPCFNSTFADGEIRHYREINIGFALDDGRGLMVPVIHQADQKSVPQIVQEIERLFAAYDEARLSPNDLGRGTFTISDLSQYQVPFFLPLISRGQGAILGVCGEILPEDGGDGGQSLLLTFDHQIADGLQAANFLTGLASRLSYYETAFRRGDGPPRVPDARPAVTPSRVTDPFCSVCSRSVSELRSVQARLVKTIEESGDEMPVCTICLAGF
jgi:pyruvate/2-oxoglutarate dehydrogenase complex dihydrolipoamide acyltransferase (E2) component